MNLLPTKGRHRRGLVLTLLYLVSPATAANDSSGNSFVDDGTNTTVSATTAVDDATTTVPTTTVEAESPTSPTTVEFPINLDKFSCESANAMETPGTPVHLTSISTGNGPKTILLAPLENTDSTDTTGGNGAATTSRMCILFRWSLGQYDKDHGRGYYHPLGRSIPEISNGEWTEPPGRPARELEYICGEASNSGTYFSQGEYLCQVTLPWTRVIHADYSHTSIHAPYFMTYYERNLSVRNEISRFLLKGTFGPRTQDLDELEDSHAKLVSAGLSSADAMAKLQIEWTRDQMDPSTFSSGSFSSLRKYWRQRVNARMFEVYRIGESGPGPCEKNSRWRKFAFTKYDVQNARYLRWGDDGVTTQFQTPHKITVETVDLRAPTDPPVNAPTPLPISAPTNKPVVNPTLSPTSSSAPTGTNVLAYGDFESDNDELIKSAWSSRCTSNILDISSTDPDNIHSGSKSYYVSGGACSVMRMIGTNCPDTFMSSSLSEGDTIKISLWVKMTAPGQVFQIFTGHYHPSKSSRWSRPKDDSYVISRTLIDNAGRWKYIEAYHTVGDDWTFDGQVLKPKLCNHYQLRFNLAKSTASYIMDDVRIEKVGLSLSDDEKQVLFLKNPSFVLSHKMWKLSATSGTNRYDDEIGQNVMQLKRGQVLRQVITDTAVPAESYSFGFYARLINSSKPVGLKVILRMRFTNNDRVYGPCRNPICNLYQRPVKITLSPGSDWQHIRASSFTMYGDYTAWDGNVDFILFQVTTTGMTNAASVRIANFHDLQQSSVPPSLSLVPSSSPTFLSVEDVAYVVSYAGHVRTVINYPFQIDATGEILPMDGSVEYQLCRAEEIEGKLSSYPNGLGFIVDGKCVSIRGGNPTVDLDPRYLDTTNLHILDLSNSAATSITPINADQTYGGDLLLQAPVDDDLCSTFPSPYDNDYRGANDENPDAVPSRFNPDDNVFALLPDGSYSIYDPRIILHENSLESPLMDGGGAAVLRSTLRANKVTVTQRGSGMSYHTSNDQSVVLCSNDRPNFMNREHCVLSYDENVCTAEEPYYFGEQRHNNVQITLTLNKATLAALHNATIASYKEANETANTAKVDNSRYIFSVSNLRYDDSNTNGSYPLPCMRGNPKSRWIPRTDLNASSCLNTLEESSVTALANAIENSNDANQFLRDIYLWNDLVEDGCDPVDASEHGMLIMTDNEGCWQNVHPDHMAIYDFTNYISKHPSSNPDDLTKFVTDGIMEYPSNHPMSYFETLKEYEGAGSSITFVARFGDSMVVDDFANLVGLKFDPIALVAIAELGEMRLNNAIYKNRGGGTLVCGSNDEVAPDPTLDDFFDVVHADLNCVGCQKSYGDYFAQKQTVWTLNAIEAEDQLCARMAWALYELVNVGTTTAPDNTESNLYTYDIFQRHCFGNYYDILKEMSYSPKMGEQFGYVMSTSTRFGYDGQKIFVHPDENYAREIMQLYTIGLHYLNDDGTEVKDPFGRVITTYNNQDILSNARIWTGLDYAARRGNVEELFRADKSRQDPMRIAVDTHDFLPKLTLGSWIGDRYPLCADLPRYHFLKIGAEWNLRGGSSVPNSQSMPESYDADEGIKRFVLSTSSGLYKKLCKPDGSGVCQFSNTVIIDENLPCYGKECRVDMLVIVQVAPGVFYEYIRPPCVRQSFYENARKVVSGIELSLGVGMQYSYSMCADPTVASAARSCCSADGIMTVNHNFEFHGERVTAATNEMQCQADGKTVCDPITVIAGEPLVKSKLYYNFAYPSANTFYWTDIGCTQFVIVRSDGMVAFVNEVPKNSEVIKEEVVPFVSLEGSVTYITMPWKQDALTLDYLYPSSEDNSCDNEACSTLGDGSCLCPVTANEEIAVFDSLPNRTEVLSNLYIGAFNPVIFSDSPTSYSLVDSSSDVEAWSTGTMVDASTIFKVTDEYGENVYLKNIRLDITIGSSYTMRNPVSFMDLAKVDELDATYEVEAFLKYLMRHPNTPAFVSKKMIQYFGVSNPSPAYATRVTQAFKNGSFTKNGVTFGDGSYGNLGAVAAAILLDPETLNVVVDDDPINGNVREPLLKVIQALRSLSFTRTKEAKLSTGLLKDLPWKVGQMVFQPPDQFSFFSSDYSPPGIFTDLDFVSPESQLLSMSSVVGITNGFFSLVNFGLSNADGGFGPFLSKARNVGDYSSSVGHVAYKVTGADISNKIDGLDTVLTGGRLGSGTKQVLTEAYRYFYLSRGTEAANRVLMALALSSPEFHTGSTLNQTDSKRSVTPPATKSSEPYKAIVYIYLSGGVDSFNILAPHSENECYLYNDYFKARGGAAGVGLTVDDMLPINGTSAGIEGCNTFGVNKLLSAYKEIYDEGKGIFLANMGHLHKPVSKANWMTETRTDLFSHHSMKREAQFVDAFRESAGPGVLGRMCDVLEDQGHAVSATSVNVQSPMVEGDPAKGRYADSMSTEGLPKIYDRQFLNGRSQDFRPYLEDLNAETTDNSGVMSSLWSQRFVDIWDKTDKLVEAMRGTTPQTAFTQSGPDIGAVNQQLKLVAQLMLNRDKRGNGVNRDVFFVEMGGFDTHSEMDSILKTKLPALNHAVKNFWAEIKAQGLDLNVTVIQGSEFGRTISANSNAGTDHAWGGNYFVFGGSIAGGKILGEYPKTFDESDSRNIGRGRIIPKHSWEALWYGVMQWFGITDSVEMDYVLPNSANFGCDLFTDSDLYVTGTNVLQGCGGPKLDTQTDMEITEPRMLTGEEQKGLCKIAIEAASKQIGISGGDTRCFIVDQVITPIEGRRRLNGEETEQLYSVSARAELNFDTSIPKEVANPKKINDIMTVASNTASERVVVGAIRKTEAPSESPSMAPSASSAPSTETAAPTRAPVAPMGLPFSSADIGYCAYDGESYESSDGIYYVKGSGDDIWGTSDAFHYMYVETSGDADVAILIDSFSHRDPWSKVGVMFRASLAKDAPNYSCFLTGENGIVQQHRRFIGFLSEIGMNIASVNSSSIWLRISKVGNVLTAFYREASASFWVPFGNQLSIASISSSDYYIGIAITSHANNDPTLASVEVSSVELYRTCNSESISTEQCDQATNCELGLRTLTCYDSGTILTQKVKIQLPGTEYLHLAEVEVLDAYGDNVALHKPADMSSIYDPYYFPYPADGVDGVIVGSMFHTDIEVGPWWEVDLVDPVEVKEVIIYNREHSCLPSCQSRVNGAIVSLINEKNKVFDTRDVGVIQTIERRRAQTATPEPISVLMFSGVRIGAFSDQAKKVKVQLTTTNYLHLMEVAVFDAAGVNRALNKAATMSSAYNTDYDNYNPGYGVDGIISGDMFQTDIEDGAWWEVDLGDSPVRVKQIVLHQRTDCCQERLSNAVVSLINDRGSAYDQKSVGNTEGVLQITLNFEETKRSVLPPKELELAGYFEYFGPGWCRDSRSLMYDYLRFFIEGVTPQVCQDKCSIHFSGLTGVSTYNSYYCYCWYTNDALPSPPPSDVHAYSSSHMGTGEVSVTLNEADSDCYQFFENKVDTETPTLMPTEYPTPMPSGSPVKLFDLPPVPSTRAGDTAFYISKDEAADFGTGDFRIEMTLTGKGFTPSAPSKDYGILFTRTESQKDDGPHVTVYNNGNVWFRIQGHRTLNWERLLCENALPNPESQISRHLIFEKSGNTLRAIIDGKVYSTAITWQLPTDTITRIKNSPIVFRQHSAASNQRYLYMDVTNVIVTPPLLDVTESPTGSPTQTELPGSFSFVGHGYCADSMNRWYDNMQYGSSRTAAYSQPAACADRCKQTSYFRGFSLRDGYWCHCFYDNNMLATDTTSTDLYFTSDLNNGEGPVTTVKEGYSGVSCFSYTQGTETPCATSGIQILPLNMPGQVRTVATPQECQQRCIDTPGCMFFNSFPDGGCHITTGADGTSSSSPATNVAGDTRCMIVATEPEPCITSGIWHLPLDMPGQGRTVASPYHCQQRCINTPGCMFYNNFPNGGCHITTGADGTAVVSNNPTRMTGDTSCDANSSTNAPSSSFTYVFMYNGGCGQGASALQRHNIQLEEGIDPRETCFDLCVQTEECKGFYHGKFGGTVCDLVVPYLCTPDTNTGWNFYQIVPAPTISPSTSPSQSFTGYFPFVHLGTGFCLDSNNAYYHRIWLDGGDVSGPQDCIDFCTQANVNELVGITMRIEIGDCECNLNDSSAADPTEYVVKPGGGSGIVSLYTSGATGSANVVSASNQGPWQCYRNENYATFSFVHLGTGFCLDSNNAYYHRIWLDGGDVSGPQDCIDFCTQANVNELVGITMRIEIGDCECNLNDSSAADPTEYIVKPGDGSGVVSLYTSGATGSANVVSASNQSPWQCYRNENYATASP